MTPSDQIRDLHIERYVNLSCDPLCYKVCLVAMRGHVTRATRHIKESGVLRGQVYQGRCMCTKGSYEELAGILGCLRDPFLEAR
jgi:hypothetical protein